MSKFDDDLMSFIYDKDSKANPAIYRDTFKDRLDEFKYVIDKGDNISIVSPDLDNFDFSSGLKILEIIMNGIVGTYIEISPQDYEKIFNKRFVNSEFIENVDGQDIFILRYDNYIQKIENNMKRKFVKYPFSNTPPFKIFEEGDKFISNNVDSWIEDAIEMAKKYISR